MLRFRVYLLDDRRHVISAANLYCTDEEAAKEQAQQLVDTNDVELWQLDRRIAIFKSHPCPGSDYSAASSKIAGRDARVSQAEK
jgi:hypothetical protein